MINFFVANFLFAINFGHSFQDDPHYSHQVTFKSNKDTSVSFSTGQFVDILHLLEFALNFT